MGQEAEAESGKRESRLVPRLLAQWQSLALAKNLPKLTDIEPRSFGDMWQHCYLLDVAGGCRDPRLIEIGAGLARDSGGVQPGQPVSRMPRDCLIGHAARYWNLVVERKIPVAMGGEFIDHFGRSTLYRSIILPLGGAADYVDYLLGAADAARR